ncbi:MAG: hypothetical protein FD123_4271 [Bacteroidetes bacterium]|nr:MAG: hypothetical protein FD123_4271 [Bacteroidota bacterium]
MTTTQELHNDILDLFSLDGPYGASEYENRRNVLADKIDENAAAAYLFALFSSEGQHWAIPSDLNRNVFVYSVVDFFIICGLDIWKIMFPILKKNDLTEADRAGALQFLPVNLSKEAIDIIGISTEDVKTKVLAETLVDLFEDWAKPELIPMMQLLQKKWEHIFPSEVERINELLDKIQSAK